MTASGEHAEAAGLPATGSGRSDDLKTRTRDVVEGRDIFGTRDGQLHFKHATYAFDTVAEDDFARGVLKRVERRTGAETTFDNADALTAAGWVID